MLALSTSLQSGGAVTAEGMVAALKNLEITGIELSYRISEDLYREMKNPLERSGLDVVSVHNYFPIPSVKPESTGGGDLFLLSSVQKQVRQNAVQFTALKPFLKADTIKVIELKPKIPTLEVSDRIRFVKEQLLG